WRRHLARAALVVALSIGPWLAWRLLAGEAEAARLVTWHPPSPAELELAAATWSGWLVPFASLRACVVVGLLVGAWIALRLLVLLVRRRERSWRSRFELALCTMAL